MSFLKSQRPNIVTNEYFDCIFFAKNDQSQRVVNFLTVITSLTDANKCKYHILVHNQDYILVDNQDFILVHNQDCQEIHKNQVDLKVKMVYHILHKI